MSVNSTKCICCGECIRVCPHDARDYVDDTEEYMKVLDSSVPTILLVSPEIKAIYPVTWKGILRWFREHGTEIYDISFGADICTWATVRAISLRRVGKVITHPCAAIVNYAELYHNELLENLAPIYSPACCEAIYVRNYLNKGEKIAVLSSCIAKKREFIMTDLVEYNITFKKVDEYFLRNGIRIPNDEDPTNYDFDFNDQQGQLGSIYSRRGGMSECLTTQMPDLFSVVSDGVHNVYWELEQYYKTNPDYVPDVFEVHSCQNSCNGGVGVSEGHTNFDLLSIMRDVEKSAREKRRSGIFNKSNDKLFKRFDDMLHLDDFMREFRKMKPTPRPTPEQLEPIFMSMGKDTPEKRSINCQGCGYHTCEDMAIAIQRGLSVPGKCVCSSVAAAVEAVQTATPAPMAAVEPVAEPTPAPVAEVQSAEPAPAPQAAPVEPIIKEVEVVKEVEVIKEVVKVVQNEEMAAEIDALRTIQSKCITLTNNLHDDLRLISESTNVIQKTNEKLDEKSGAVNKLLESLLEYCSHNQTMEADSVQQLISILEATIRAFRALDDYAATTTSNSVVINQSVEKIKRMVTEIGDVLKNQTSTEGESEE